MDGTGRWRTHFVHFPGGWLSHFFQIYAHGSTKEKLGFVSWVESSEDVRFSKTCAAISLYQNQCIAPTYIEPGLVVVDDLHANHPAPSTHIIQSQQINPSSKYSPCSWNIHHRDVFFDWTSRTRPISIATFSKSHSAAWRFRIIFSLSSVWDPWLSAGPL